MSYFYSKQQPATQSPSNNTTDSTAPRDVSFSQYNLKPNISTKEEVYKILGNPVSRQQQGDYTMESFANPNSVNRQHQVVLEENIVKVVKEIVAYNDSRSISDITNILGSAPTVLFGPDQESGVYLYVYETRGVAYLGNQLDGNNSLFEVWFFPPTTTETFISSWAREYSPFPSFEEHH